MNRLVGPVPATAYFTDAGWSSQVAREAHNLEVAGSNPVPAISKNTAESSTYCYLPAFGSAAQESTERR